LPILSTRIANRQFGASDIYQVSWHGRINFHFEIRENRGSLAAHS
jgi:hypothetical protein